MAGLVRPSTPSSSRTENVDARDKPGHDDLSRIFKLMINLPIRPYAPNTLAKPACASS